MRIRSSAGGVGLVIAVALSGCSLTDLTNVDPPSNIADPAAVQTYDGAISLYRGSIVTFADAFAGGSSSASYALSSGLFTDEYQYRRSDGTSMPAQLDLRTPLPSTGSTLYGNLHTARQNIELAIGSLQQYAPTAPGSYLGEMYALEGYVYVMFGEMFCSGVPFSRTIYNGGIEFGKPLTTAEMFQTAAALFDTALTHAGDTLSVRRLALVGKARALLDLNQPAEAAALVSPADVPTAFAYTTTYTTTNSQGNYLGFATGTDFINVTASNGEGTNGIPFVAAGDSGDARVAMVRRGSNNVAIPVKLADATDPVTLADGVEARLVEAEAKLRANDIDGWAQTLNDLRATAIAPAIPALPTDSTLDASPELRLAVMFRERALWLFGTGHRQGDLRRLIRQYGLSQSAVYPVGTHPTVSPPLNAYGTAVTLSPPKDEENNPNYHGCIDAGA
jgi:hypothetical protein